MSVKKNNYLEISASLHSDIITNFVAFNRLTLCVAPWYRSLSGGKPQMQLLIAAKRLPVKETKPRE